jgi:SAM-dependent methyltransferase
LQHKKNPPDVNEDSTIYYEGQYWNSLDCTNRMINHRISGDEAINWSRHFAIRTKRVFERALILNCGNGWVERAMLDDGLIKEAVGIDYSESLLNEARSAAEGRPLHYVQMNINTDDLPAGPFDLVVNHAAAHHVMRLNRVFKSLCDLLPEDGWFISFDYVGPHRNQYSIHAWDQAWRLNQTLPENVRQSMDYPLVDLFVQIDPTEAVHSELIVETLQRYFHVSEYVPLGGALAYPLLTHNSQLFSANVDSHEREYWGQLVLDRDTEYLTQNPESSLFAYFTAQPNKSVLSNHEELEALELRENMREARAAEGDGTYYDRSLLNALYWERALLQNGIKDLQEELEAIRGSFLYSHLTKLLDTQPARRFMQSRLVRSLRTYRESSQ